MYSCSWATARLHVHSTCTGRNLFLRKVAKKFKKLCFSRVIERSLLSRQKLSENTTNNRQQRAVQKLDFCEPFSRICEPKQYFPHNIEPFDKILEFPNTNEVSVL